MDWEDDKHVGNFPTRISDSNGSAEYFLSVEKV